MTIYYQYQMPLRKEPIMTFVNLEKYGGCFIPVCQWKIKQFNT